MDRPARLAGLVAYFVLGLVIALACGTAWAVNYEYTPKVVATTGGQAKGPGYTYPTGGWQAIGGYSGTPTPISLNAYMQGWASGCTSPYTCVTNGVSIGSLASPVSSASVLYCTGASCTPNTNATHTFNPTCPNGATLYAMGDTPTCRLEVASVCPAGTSENTTDHLCYPQVCPTATPAWESDPGDSTRCRRATACPWAAQWSDGSCSCPNSAIQAQAQFGLSDFFIPGKLAEGASACMGGCNVTVGPVLAQVQTSGGVWSTAAELRAGSGAFCADPPISETKPSVAVPNEAASCLQSGGSWGTVNNVGQCLPKGGAGTTEVPKTPTTGSTTKTNPDGSTETTTTTTTPVTKCEAGTCTTTITTTTTVVTKDSAGTVTGTTTTSSTTTGPATGGSGGKGNGTGDGYESSFGGACASGFVCDGDAVQCATALVLHRQNCRLYGGDDAFASDWLTRGGDALKGADTLIQGSEHTLSSLNTTARINAGSCPVPSVFATPLGQVTISWDAICTAAGWFSWIIVSVSLIIAARIVLGGL